VVPVAQLIRHATTNNSSYYVAVIITAKFVFLHICLFLKTVIQLTIEAECILVNRCNVVL